MRLMSKISLFISILMCSIAFAQSSSLFFQETRQLPSDLEVGGDLAGLPPESTRYITRENLLALPQVNFVAKNDTNFTGATTISGVKLEELARRLGASSAADLVVAICDDGYRANYPRAYIAAHRPVLVLNVNGKPPAGWPKDAQNHEFDMGPYMISHPNFTPSFKILSHVDEAQIPWGVVRIEFRDEKVVFGAIAPRVPHARDPHVRDGYLIARQNCFRCHNAGREGGIKSGRSWQSLAEMASKSPGAFAAYIRDPSVSNPNAHMPANPQYDGATIAALTAYFQTFSGQTKP